ncbi:MAG: DUF1036 domain-containing protein [Alphaproteobacteria bacterium]|nr:DUF1036 domain-containing protein [Alphaproteobacteria bacterium]
MTSSQPVLRILLAGGVILTAMLVLPRGARAALSFCNRTQAPIEAAIGYHGDTGGGDRDWVSEGWWRIEPGQCARVYGENLTQRFYFYYAYALTQTAKDTPPTVWAGKYTLCTGDKAFRIRGDNNCIARGYRATGFHELDTGGSAPDYTLDFKDSSSTQ